MVTICYSCAALVLLTVLCVPSVYSYSAGAREESCYNMQAVHFDTISGRNKTSFVCSPCPFSLELVAQVNPDNRTVIDDGTITTYECGKVYEVFVTTSQNQFEGYMLEARETTTSGDFEETSTIWGKWQARQDDPYHAVDCKRNKDSTEPVVGAAATQNEGNQILNVTLYWRAPLQPESYSDYQNLPESITLWVTIVQAELAYFFPISGPVLARNCTEPPSPSPTDVPIVSTSTGAPMGPSPTTTTPIATAPAGTPMASPTGTGGPVVSPTNLGGGAPTVSGVGFWAILAMALWAFI